MGDQRVVNPNWDGVSPSANEAPPLSYADGACFPPKGIALPSPDKSAHVAGRDAHANRTASPKSASPRRRTPQLSYAHFHGAEPQPPPDTQSCLLTKELESPTKCLYDHTLFADLKRRQMWEAEFTAKTQVNESRARPEDQDRTKEQRRAEEPWSHNIYDSPDTAHTPYPVSHRKLVSEPTQSTSQLKQPVVMAKKEGPQTEQSVTATQGLIPTLHERAARDMDIDEDYSDI